MAELVLATCVLGAFVFGTSAFTKLASRRGYRAYRAGLAQTRLLPARPFPAAAAALVACEALIALGLAGAAVSIAVGDSLPPMVAQVPLIAAFVLTTVLASGVAVAVRRGVQARCPCFGASAGRPLGWGHVARNLTLLAVLGCGLVAAMLGGDGGPSAAGAITSAGAGAVLALLFTRWDDLAGIFAPLPSADAARLARARMAAPAATPAAPVARLRGGRQ